MKNFKSVFYSALMLMLFSCETERTDHASVSAKEHNNRQIISISNEEMIRKGLQPQFTLNDDTISASGSGKIRYLSNANSKNQNEWTKITKANLQFMKYTNGSHFDHQHPLRARFTEVYKQNNPGFSHTLNAVYFNKEDLAYPWTWLTNDNQYYHGNINSSQLPENPDIFIRQTAERKNLTYSGTRPLASLYSDWTPVSEFPSISYPNNTEDEQQMGGFDAQGWGRAVTTTLGWNVTAGATATLGGKVGFWGITEGSFSASVSLEAGANGNTSTTHSISLFLPPVKVPKGHMVTYTVMKRKVTINVEYRISSEFKGNVWADYNTPALQFISVPASKFFHEYHKSPNPMKIHLSWPKEQYLVDYQINPIH